VGFTVVRHNSEGLSLATASWPTIPTIVAVLGVDICGLMSIDLSPLQRQPLKSKYLKALGLKRMAIVQRFEVGDDGLGVWGAHCLKLIWR